MLDASRIINGSFGQVFMGEKWLSNFNKMEANVEIQKTEITDWRSRRRQCASVRQRGGKSKIEGKKGHSRAVRASSAHRKGL